MVRLFYLQQVQPQVQFLPGQLLPHEQLLQVHNALMQFEMKALIFIAVIIFCD